MSNLDTFAFSLQIHWSILLLSNFTRLLHTFMWSKIKWSFLR